MKSLKRNMLAPPGFISNAIARKLAMTLSDHERQQNLEWHEREKGISWVPVFILMILFITIGALVALWTGHITPKLLYGPTANYPYSTLYNQSLEQSSTTRDPRTTDKGTEVRHGSVNLK